MPHPVEREFRHLDQHVVEVLRLRSLASSSSGRSGNEEHARPFAKVPVKPMNSTVLVTLKSVWALAICRSGVDAMEVTASVKADR